MTDNSDGFIKHMSELERFTHFLLFGSTAILLPKFLMKDKDIVKITYNKLNEIFEMTVTSFITEG